MLCYYNTVKDVEKMPKIEGGLDELFERLMADTLPEAKHYRRSYTFVQNIVTPRANRYKQNIFDNVTPTEDLSYNTFKIPKKTGGYREICAPNDSLKRTQQDILTALKEQCPYVHNAAHAYVPGRCCKDALLKHVKNKSHWYLKIDLKSFFPSCTEELVLKKLQQVYPFHNLSEEEKHTLIKYCFKDGALPQGSPVSPYLSNIIMTEFDYWLTDFCAPYKLVYTRYADDILISGYEKFDSLQVINIIDYLLTEYYDSKLKINKDKTRFGNSAGKNWNMGMMVTKDNRITVGNKRKRLLKQSLYNYKQNKDNFQLEDLYTLLGELQYVCMIEPNIYKDMYEPKYGDVRQEIINHIKTYSVAV